MELQLSHPEQLLQRRPSVCPTQSSPRSGSQACREWAVQRDPAGHGELLLAGGRGEASGALRALFVPLGTKLGCSPWQTASAPALALWAPRRGVRWPSRHLMQSPNKLTERHNSIFPPNVHTLNPNEIQNTELPFHEEELHSPLS